LRQKATDRIAQPVSRGKEGFDPLVGLRQPRPQTRGSCATLAFVRKGLRLLTCNP
jgi:hypothetical protein